VSQFLPCCLAHCGPYIFAIRRFADLRFADLRFACLRLRNEPKNVRICDFAAEQQNACPPLVFTYVYSMVAHVWTRVSFYYAGPDAKRRLELLFLSTSSSYGPRHSQR
jgi:hypothetical protein